jgi:hypothetical protein
MLRASEVREASRKACDPVRAALRGPRVDRSNCGVQDELAKCLSASGGLGSSHERNGVPNTMSVIDWNSGLGQPATARGVVGVPTALARMPSKPHENTHRNPVSINLIAAAWAPSTRLLPPTNQVAETLGVLSICSPVPLHCFVD